MSMIPSQAPGDDPETTVPLEETETAEQVHEVESVHSLSDNEENMTVDDSQENDTAIAPGPDVEVGDNLSDGDGLRILSKHLHQCLLTIHLVI